MDVLPALGDESVQCVMTSPPYWGLRDYKSEPQVWGGGECEHEWVEEKVFRQMRYGLGLRDSPASTRGGAIKVATTPDLEFTRAFCSKCDAWRGPLGLEPTPDLYIEHLVSVFRGVRRVLRKDGTLWLNLGDSYASQGGPEPAQTKWQVDGASNTQAGGQSRKPTGGLKPKDLCGIPWRVALALQADGWWLRSDIVWHKKNCMPGSQKDRPTMAHEYLFLLTKSARYFFDQEAVREPLAVPVHKPGNRDPGQIQGMKEYRDQGGHSQFRDSTDREWGTASGRNIRSVWTIATQPFCGEFCTDCKRYYSGAGKKQIRVTTQADGKKIRWCICGRSDTWLSHFATFPPALVEPCIKAGSREGDTALDPFAGAGTVGVVCKRLGRDFVGIELNPDYCLMAQDRIDDRRVTL